MNSKKIYFVYSFAICICLSIILQAYLTNKYFQIHYGEGPTGDALCNISQKFDCEAVTASSYNKFLGIPLSTWGLGLNLSLFILLLGMALSEAHKKYWLSALRKLCLISVLGSLVMGLISLSLMSVYCLFCIFLYILSFVQLYLSLFLGPDDENPKKAFYSLFRFKFEVFPYQVYICLLLFPLISLFVTTKMKRHLGGKRADTHLKYSVQAWTENKEVVEFNKTPPLLATPPTPETSSFEIVEFADFLCGHCRRASKVIKSFMATHKAQFKFYSFPVLDRSCWSEDNKNTGPSCYLAKSTFCAQKQNKGWEFHDWIFEHQKELIKIHFKEIKSQIEKLSEQLKMDQKSFLSCIEEEDTHKFILNQIQWAQDLKITATPTIFVNGKPLKSGPILELLKRIYNISVDN